MNGFVNRALKDWAGPAQQKPIVARNPAIVDKRPVIYLERAVKRNGEVRVGGLRGQAIGTDGDQGRDLLFGADRLRVEFQFTVADADFLVPLIQSRVRRRNEHGVGASITIGNLLFQCRQLAGDILDLLAERV
jgi:hypothetical protein